ncbi:MAG: potassium channel family protein [Bacteroidales bacterium]|nr:potassium channel family protein [Bacteroidales bacterium]
MHRYFTDFKVEIADVQFKFKEFTYPKTAVIKFFSSENKLISEEKLGYADIDFIKSYIEKNSELRLDYCFVENYNLDFLKSQIHGQKIILSNFSASNTFFNSPGSDIDFSGILFESKNVDFNNTCFNCKNLNFSESSFFAETVDFSNTAFKCETVNFSKTSFSEGDVSFKNALFSEGIKDFRRIEFQNGKVIFINVDFNDGDVMFTDTSFNSGANSFKVAQFGKGRVDFTSVKFGKDETSFDKTIFGNGDVSFRSADFQNGKVSFTSAEFGKGKKSFINTNFGDANIYFKNANFGDGTTSFRLAVFGHGIVDFHFCEFGNGTIQFDRTKFINGGINLKAANFGDGKVSFYKTYFGDGDINFEGCTLSGELLIKDSVFGKGEFNFKEANFADADVEIINVDFGIGKISFNKSTFRTLSLRGSQLDNYFDLQISKCEMLDLSHTVVKDIVDINPPDFDPEIKAIDFSGMRLLGRIYIDWRRTNLKELIYNQETTYKSKEEQFRILKENYNLTGQYSYEDEAYVEFKRTEAITHLKEDIRNKPALKFVAYIKFAFKWLIFDKMGKFATDPLRVLLTMFITYLLFTFLYVLLGEFGDIHIVSSLFDPGDPRTLTPLGKAFYHSAITFLTIGYGDYYPDGIARWLSSIEGFVGLFLMSYFTVAFVRKILR